MTASQCGALVARIKHGRNAFTRIAKFVSALLSVYSRSPPSYQLARFPSKWNRFDDKKARQHRYAEACSYRESAYTLPNMLQSSRPHDRDWRFHRSQRCAILASGASALSQRGQILHSKGFGIATRSSSAIAWSITSSARWTFAIVPSKRSVSALLLTSARAQPNRSSCSRVFAFRKISSRFCFSTSLTVSLPSPSTPLFSACPAHWPTGLPPLFRGEPFVIEQSLHPALPFRRR